MDRLDDVVVDEAILQFISSDGTNRHAIDLLEKLDLDFAIQASLLIDNQHQQLQQQLQQPPFHDTSLFVCDICSDTKSPYESFNVKGCDHSYCSDCIRSYVGSKLENGVSNISCPEPECPGSLDPEHCRNILPRNVFIRWGKSLCESVISPSEKFYCPFKDCSAMMVNDDREVVMESKCPNCNRMFCARCKVAWHGGMDCTEYQKLGEDERGREDLMFRDLAKNKNWKRCPSCKIFVDRTAGCNYIKCRCGVSFCYNCGAINNDHVHHRCPNCTLIYS